VHHRLHACPDRLKPRQAQQVESSRPQRRHRASTVAPVAVGVLLELGIADPVPDLDAPAVSHQLQQAFWGGAQAGEKQVGGLEGSGVAGPDGDQLDDPAGADPGLADVLRGLFGPQRPGDVAAVADLVIRCHKRDLALSPVSRQAPWPFGVNQVGR